MDLEKIPVDFHQQLISSFIRRVDCGKCQLSEMKKIGNPGQILPLNEQIFESEVLYDGHHVGTLSFTIGLKHFEIYFSSEGGVVNAWRYYPASVYRRKHIKRKHKRPSFKKWGLSCKKSIEKTHTIIMRDVVTDIMEV
jgi:hypothetical protein